MSRGQRYDAVSVRDACMMCRRWLLSGRVQGVGFRWFVLQAAQRLAVEGTVRNLTGGEVEVVARADEGALERLDTLLRQGPPAARVADVQVEPGSLPSEHNGFHVTH